MKYSNRQYISDNMKWSKVRDFFKFGFRSEGFLLVADLIHAGEMHSQSGEFNSGVPYDVLNIAKDRLKDMEYIEKLTLAVLVVQVSEEDWDSFKIS